MKNIIKSILTFLFMVIMPISFTVIAQENGGGDRDWTYFAQQQGYLPQGDLGGGDGTSSSATTSSETTSSSYSSASSTNECKGGCCGIKLNTNFPIIGNCIGTTADSKTNPTNAFPYMMSALTKIVMSLILVVCFIIVIVAGIMWAGAGDDSSKKTSAKKLIEKVAVTVLLLGFSGVILRLINPNFFG